MRTLPSITALGLLMIVSTVAFNAVSAEKLDFFALDRALHSLITNRQTSDAVLLQAISRLGPVTERPSFWWSILDDSTYLLSHRGRALFALFRRHAETRHSVTDLRTVLGNGIWFREATFSKVTYVFGRLPVEVNDGESVFCVTFFGSLRVYIRVLGQLDEKTFEKILKGEQTTKDGDPIIIQYGYEDDYDEWYHTNKSRARGN